MKVSEVTKEDGYNCAILIESIKKATWKEASLDDLNKIGAAVKWLSEVAGKMAVELKGLNTPTPEVTPPVGGFRIKSSGSLSSPTRKKKK